MDRKKFVEEILKDKEIKSKATGLVVGVKRPAVLWVSTGNYALDWCISDKLIGGGLPVGRIVELFGEPSTGKSLLVAKIMGEVQKLGGIAIFDDVEESRDEEFMKRMGCDVSEEAMITMTSTTVEQHFEVVRKQIDLLREKGFKGPIVVVLDSLAALSTKHEIESGLDKIDLSRAKVIRAAMRLLAGEFARKDVLYIVNNHVIEDIGETYRSKFKPRSTPGGGGIKFHASVRVELSVAEVIMNSVGLVVGTKFKAEVVKSKISPPFRTCYFEVNFEKGIDPFSGLFDVLVKVGIVKHSGSGWYLYKDSNKKLREIEVMELVKEEINEKGSEAFSFRGGCEVSG